MERYSPRPYTDYVVRAGDYDLGLANTYGKDPELWNLLWLAVPEFDNYLGITSATECKVVTLSINAEVLGFCIRALDGDDVEDFGDPPMREILAWPVLDFMTELAPRHQRLMLFQEYPQTLQTMWKRARSISSPVLAAPAPSGNVIYGNFGGKRS